MLSVLLSAFSKIAKPLFLLILPIRPLTIRLVTMLMLLATTTTGFGQSRNNEPENSDAENSIEEAAEEIIVTSSRIPLPRRQIGTSVSVLDEFDLQAHGNLSLVDVLRQAPAIGSNSNGGIGKTSTLRVRGEEGFRTLAILDGMRLQDPSAPQITTSFEHLLSSGISRVEILRGPQGLAYGADAGGVVNISTRHARSGLDGNVDAQTGAFGTHQLNFNLSGGNSDTQQQGTIDYFLSATDFETDGFNARTSDTALQDDDGYENTTLHGRFGVAFSEQWRLDLTHRNTEASSEYDGCFAGTTVHDCTSDSELSANRLELSYDGELSSQSLSYSSTVSERALYALGSPSFATEGELTRWEYVGSATALQGFDLSWGADHEEALIEGAGRDNAGIYLEVLSDFSEQLFLTAGVRHDDNDDFGTNTSYRVSGAYLLALSNGATLKLKSAFGTGFRAPSPYEIAYNAGPFAYPPASVTALLQEESEGWEVGAEYYFGELHLEAVYFTQDVDNAIDFDLASFSGYLQDIGTSNSRGLELIAEIPLGNSLQLQGNYTFNDTERPDGSPRLRRPEKLLNAGLVYSGADNRLTISGFYRAQADAIDSGGAIKDFNVVDLTASYQLSDSIRLYGRVENLFAEKYQEVLGFNTADRAAYAGINFRFAGL